MENFVYSSQEYFEINKFGLIVAYVLDEGFSTFFKPSFKKINILCTPYYRLFLSSLRMWIG